MRSDRLLSIMLLLQTYGQLPAAELAEHLEVSVRTIMRDVEALSSAGVPVYTIRGPHGGIALLPGYRTDVTGLTADEARSLFVLLSDDAHADLGLGQAFGSALRKLMAALPAAHRPEADLPRRRIDDIPTPVHVTVDVPRHVLGKFLRIHQTDLAVPPPAETDDQLGRVQVELAFPSLTAAEVLLGFAPEAEVLTPPELRQALAHRATQAASLYTNSPGGDAHASSPEDAADDAARRDHL